MLLCMVMKLDLSH